MSSDSKATFQWTEETRIGPKKLLFNRCFSVNKLKFYAVLKADFINHPEMEIQITEGLKLLKQIEVHDIFINFQ